MNERDRIELLMKSYNLSPSQFADKTGIQRASVSHILSGRNKPSLEVMLKIYEAFPGLSMEWLMAGIGDGPVGGTSGVKEQVEQSQPTGLFGDMEDVLAVNEGHLPFVNMPLQETVLPIAKKQRVQSETVRQADVQSSQPEKRRATQARQAVQVTAVQRKIKEVRIFYTDGTYETLIPEK